MDWANLGLLKRLAPDLFRLEPLFFDGGDVARPPLSYATATLLVQVLQNSAEFNEEVLNWARRLNAYDLEKAREILQEWWRENEQLFKDKNYKAVKPGREMIKDTGAPARTKGAKGVRRIFLQPTQQIGRVARMPRQVRIEYAGATYHVMCRGDRREAIFADDRDRQRFLATLAEAVGKTGWRLHGYVLMSNHYHLLLETPAPNLVRGMTWFQTTYTTRYNSRHRTSGHLFGGRYKAVVIDPGEPRYFAVVLDYIHLNPARAGLVQADGTDLLDYGWSSLAGYVRREQRPPWLAVERGFAAHDLDDTAAHRRRLLEDLERRIREETAERCGVLEIEGQSLQSTLRRGWYFGREAFREWLLEKADGILAQHRQSKQNYHGPEIADHGLEQARRVLTAGLAQLGWETSLLQQLPKSDPRKVALARRVRQTTTVPLAWLAEQLAMGSAMNVSRLTRLSNATNAKISS